MRSDECSTGTTAKIIVMDDDDNKLFVKMGDQVLGQLVDNILNQDEQTLAEKLIFVENVSITYNKDTFIVSKINQTFPWPFSLVELCVVIFWAVFTLKNAFVCFNSSKGDDGFENFVK